MVHWKKIALDFNPCNYLYFCHMNQKIILLPTSYFPSIQYFAFILSAEKVLIEMEENFQKQSIRNRTEILGPNGKQRLSIPIKKGETQKIKTRFVQISYDTDWRKIHWKSIETAYNSSPYFLYYKDYFEKFFLNDYDKLADFNQQILLLCLKLLKVKKEIHFTTEYSTDFDGLDLRDYFTSKSNDKEVLYTPYIQVFADKYGFYPNLGIMDLLFNLGPEAKDYLLQMEI